MDWALYGPKLAQVALTMGADDVDACRRSKAIWAAAAARIEEIRGNIRRGRLEPIERNGRFVATRR